MSAGGLAPGRCPSFSLAVGTQQWQNRRDARDTRDADLGTKGLPSSCRHHGEARPARTPQASQTHRAISPAMASQGQCAEQYSSQGSGR